MKILLSGYHNPHFLTITEYMERAIGNLGHKPVVFDDRQHIVPGRLRRKIGWLNKFDLNQINNKIISLASAIKPDIAIVTGGHRITSQTVRTLKDIGACTVLWTIDAPLNFQQIINVAPFYDYICCQGTEAVELLDHAGIKGANWLPMACDPLVHRPVELSAQEEEHYGNDVVFVGSHYPNRSELIEKLTRFSLGVWGPGWEKIHAHSPLRKCLKGGKTKPNEWLKIYSASKIVLAIHYQASPRVFEALACGAFVISDSQKDVFSLFKDGQHLVRFDNPDDMIEKTKYYLEHSGERKEIAERGMREVIRNHTYIHRIQRLLSFVSKQ